MAQIMNMNKEVYPDLEIMNIKAGCRRLGGVSSNVVLW